MGAKDMNANERLRVLAMPAFRNEKSNPYNALLYRALKANGVAVEEFSFVRALLLHYEIIHVHWPEHFLNSRYRLKAAAGSALLLAVLAWARLWRRQVVWTVHNLEPHRIAYPVLNRWFWRLFPRLVDASFSLSHANREMAVQRYPALARKPGHVVRHGLYRDCYRRGGTRTQARAALGIAAEARVCLFIGQVKGYKRVDRLVELFVSERGLDGTELIIAGRFEDAALFQKLADRRAGRRNIRLVNRFIPDDELQHYLLAADLCVLPFEQIFNSGSALLAASFGCPVLVPDSANFQEYARLTGGLIRTYEGELTAAHIERNMQAAAEPRAPDASLSWDVIARETAEAFCALRAAERGVEGIC